MMSRSDMASEWAKACQQLKEANKTIDLLTTDMNYVGGVQYWMRKYDEQLARTIKLCIALLKLQNSSKTKKQPKIVSEEDVLKSISGGDIDLFEKLTKEFCETMRQRKHD